MKTLRVRMLYVVAAVAALSFSAHVFAEEAADQQAPPPADEKGPPLPFITIEGQGGGSITPMAYLVNPAPEGEIFGKPSVAFDVIGLNSKSLNTFMIT